MCFGVRDAIALAVQGIRQPAADRPGRVGAQRDRARRPSRPRDPVLRRAGRGGHAVRDDHRARRVRAPPRDRSRSRVPRAGRHLLPGPHRTRAVATLAREGFHPVIVGRRDHVEVRGLTEDLEAFDVVLDDDDVRRLTAARPLRRRRPDDAAGRAGRASGVAHPAAVSRRRGAAGRHGLCADKAAPARGRWSWRSARRPRHRHRRRPQQQYPRTRGHVPQLTARASSTCRPPAICAPSGSWPRAWSVSRPAPPRRTATIDHRRGAAAGDLPLAGWRP